MHIAYYLILVNLLFAISLELMPGMGMVWLRPNSSGGWFFSPIGLLVILAAPLQGLGFWTTPSLLPVNWIFMNLFSLSVRYLWEAFEAQAKK